jgi:hypothetical protein
MMATPGQSSTTVPRQGGNAVGTKGTSKQAKRTDDGGAIPPTVKPCRAQRARSGDSSSDSNAASPEAYPARCGCADFIDCPVAWAQIRLLRRAAER